MKKSTYLLAASAILCIAAVTQPPARPTDQEIVKMSRSELVKLAIALSAENERLEQRLADADSVNTGVGVDTDTLQLVLSDMKRRRERDINFFHKQHADTKLKLRKVRTGKIKKPSIFSGMGSYAIGAGIVERTWDANSQTFSFSDRDEKLEATKAIKAKMRDLNRTAKAMNSKDYEYEYAPILEDTVVVGSLGNIRKFTVFQIIDSENAIVEVRVSYPPNVPHVIGTYSREIYMWVNGLDFSTATDGISMKSDLCFMVIGTRRYSAVVGSNTIFEIQPFELQPYVDYMQVNNLLKLPDAP